MTYQSTESRSFTGPASNVAEYTVAEVAFAVKRTLEDRFSVVRVRGEVGRPNYHSSGHLYFTLKDAEAAIDGVAWRATVRRMSLRLEEGMEVVCTGRISSYPKNSRYQIVVESVELAGQGALLKLLEDRRKKLAAEGLFDADRKQRLPFLPEVIGVATSPTGAVIRDILHRLADRFPRHVLLWPVPVQGDGAAEEIAEAIRGFNSLRPGGPVPRPDVLIVARGGGSLEDLWQFNEEVLVRAAALSDIPLISAVGHETDTTLIDFAADVRAPTPTAAAELVVPVRGDLHARVLEHEKRMRNALARLTAENRRIVESLARGLPRPVALLENAMQTLDYQSDMMTSLMTRRLDSAKSSLAVSAARLRHPHDTLDSASRSLGQLVIRLTNNVRGEVQNCVTRFDALQPAARMKTALGNDLRTARTRLHSASAMLEGLSIDRVLERGFALVQDSTGRPVTAAASTRRNQQLSLRFIDGTVGAVVTDEPSGHRKEQPSEQDETETTCYEQGSLF